MNQGNYMYELAKRLFPICRSITGNGVRETLNIIKNEIPELKVYEVPSGTKVFDWVVPKEWNIKDAWIKDSNGRKIIDFSQSNLHVMGYSTPVSKKFPRMNYFLFYIRNLFNPMLYLTSLRIIRNGSVFVVPKIKKKKLSKHIPWLKNENIYF